MSYQPLDKTKILASKMVGDGKSPNKYFITIGFGWYTPFKAWDFKDGSLDFEMPDMVQVPGSIESVTMGPFNTLSAAQAMYDMIRLPDYYDIDEMKADTIGLVTMEDRKTGVVKEKCIWEKQKGYFIIDNR